MEGAKTDTTVTNVTVATVKRSLTFAGFVGVAPSKEDARVFQGQRVAWEAGASAPVRLSFAKPAANGNGAVAPPVANGVGNGIGSAKGGEKKTWKLALDDDDGDGVFGAGGGDDDDDDLVDEDALLDASAPVKRANESVRWDGVNICIVNVRMSAFVEEMTGLAVLCGMLLTLLPSMKTAATVLPVTVSVITGALRGSNLNYSRVVDEV